MASRNTYVTIDCGQGGINGSTDLSGFPKTDLTYAENLTAEDGTWRKIGGASLITTTPISGAPRVRGLTEFVLANGTTVRIAATGDGKIVSVVAGGVGNTLQTGLTANRFTVFAEGGGGTTKKLFRFNGADAVGVTSDGVTMAAIASPPADWATTNQPSFGFVHNGRLWGGGNPNDPHRIYGSEVINHENFSPGSVWAASFNYAAGNIVVPTIQNGHRYKVTTDAGSSAATQPTWPTASGATVVDGGLTWTEDGSDGYRTVQLSVFPGEGEGLVGGLSYKGRAFLFKKPRGIYWLDDSASDITLWTLKRLTLAVGIQSPKAVVPVEDDFLLFTVDGSIIPISAVSQQLGDVALNPLLHDKLAPFARSYINLNALSGVDSVYYPNKRQVWWCVPGPTSTVNNRMLGLDLREPENPKIMWSTRDVCESIALTKDTNGIYRPMIGDSTGSVWLLDEAARTKNGLGYGFTGTTGDLDITDDGKRLVNLRELEVVARHPPGTSTLSIQIDRDGGRKSQSLSISLPQSGVAVGSFTIGTSAIGGETIGNHRKRIVGDASRVRLTFANAADLEDCSLAKFILSVSPGNDRRR